MTWSQEISQLITDVDQLTSAANVKKSELDASVASTEADKNAAAASITSATASFASAGANSTQAEAHKNTALAIYGTNAAQQTAVASVQASAALASGYAASGSAALQQDLSGISTALHRSPNAVTSMFIYDTSKDSDGGAWTEKCQNTSWYNEPIMGKWLGPQLSELSARCSGATLGLELLINGNFDTDTSWTKTSGATIINGVVTCTTTSTADHTVLQNILVTAGKTYAVTINKVSAASSDEWAAVFGTTDGANIRFGNLPAGVYTFYYTATNTGNRSVTLGNYSDIPQSTVFTSLSVREVTAFNNASGDYFQLTTDGKFYRLWKNLLSQSNTFTNAAWLTFSGGVTVSANTTETLDPFGSNTATKFSYITGSGAIRNQVAIPINGVTSVYIKGGQGNRFSVTTGPNFGDSVIINPIDGSVVTLGTNQTSAIMTPVGNGWYRLTIIKNTTGNFLYLGYTNVAGTAGDYAYVCAAQVENGTVATVYEAKVAEGSTSEVFRGNKRDFPRLAGIVCEAASVSIYDLTEPGRPMWMRFTGAANMIISNVSISTVSALVAKLVVGGSAAVQIIDFMADSAISIQTQATFKSRQNITQRNQALGVDTVPFGAVIINNTVNSVAMTVMPDAPTDTVTGLRVPTIAVATGSGVSIIKHDGLVVSGDNQGTNNITITPNIMTWFNTAYTSSRYLLNPGKISVFPALGEYNQSTTEFGANNNTQRDFTAKRSFRLRSLTSSGPVRLLNQNDTNIMRGLTGKIGSNFNTGWLPGDNRRVYLSDNLPGTATVNIQVEDFSTYANDAAMKLVWNQGSAANGSLVGGKLRLAAASGTALGRSWPTIPGKAYSISVTVATGTVAAIRLGAASYSVSYGQFSDRPVGTWRTTFTATGTLFFAGTYGNAAGISEISNFTLTEIEIDRSYKAQVASINGTLTKSQLASGTSLVGYSGWSAANYLREPYSADLDFGTGEFSASAWLNSSSLPRRNILTTTDNLSSWGVSNVTRTLTQPDPFGGNTAVQVITNSLSGVHTLETSISTLIVGQRYTATYNLKGIGIGKVGVGSNVAGTGLNGVIAVDLLAGTFSGGPAGFINKSIQSLGNGWWKFSYQFDALQPTMNPSIYVTDASFNNFWVGDGTSGYLSSRAQMELGSVATEYQPVLDGLEYSAVIFDRAAASGPRLRLVMNGLGRLTAEAFDGTTTRTVTTTTPYVTEPWLKAEANYTTDGSLGIRVNGREVAVTRGNPLVSLTTGKNLLSFSESFDNSAWAKYVMAVTPNVAIAPDGTTTADLIYPTANNTDNSIYRGGFSSVQKTHSIYAKAAGKNWLVILQEDTTGGAAWFNLASGTIGTTSAGYTSATITPIGSDGWYRCSITSTSGFNQYTAFGAVDADNTTTVVASGTNGIYLWGAQLEATSAVTSYAATNVAPLTIGNSFALDAPFPGSITLLKLGTTVPTTEQSTFMYEQEKQLFRANAVSVLPDTNVILDMSYDDVTDRWVAISTANESYWNGLVRASVTPVPAGSYSRITTTSGVELAARITANPGVDVTIPPYVLREELVKRSETANKLNRQTAIYDYIGGFTGNITTGSTAIATVTNLTYPVSLVGARISGTGIPANTTIVAVVGTTIYISAAATATTTGLVISLLDFNLPLGFETESVTSAGVVKQEGATKDYTRLFDGFLETIRFAVAPGATTWVRIQASKSIQ